MKQSSLVAATCISLFIAALVANVRNGGTSPIAWIDTFADQSEVEACVLRDACTRVGMSTSVPGLRHAVTWLDLRTLLVWMGADLDGAHLAMHAANALGAVLVFYLALKLGGGIAGVTAMWLYLTGLDSLLRVVALYNSSILPFLGAVLVLASTAAALRPGIVSVALVALVAAVLANVHLACVLTGATIPWVALLAPRRRIPLAVFGVALFALATVILAPGTWLHDLTRILQHPEASHHPANVVTVGGDAVVRWALFGAAAWIASWIASLGSRSVAWARYRRRAQGAVAITAPFLVAFLIAPRFGLQPEGKYLLHIKAAVAIAAALPLGGAASWLLGGLSRRWLLAPSERLLPFVAALILVVPGQLGLIGESYRRDDDVPRIRDLAAVAEMLYGDRDWDLPAVLERFRTPHGAALLTAMPLSTVVGRHPGSGGGDRDRVAVLLTVKSQSVPEPLPPGWNVIRRSASTTTALVFLRSRLDHRAFRVCMQPAGASEWKCATTGWASDATGHIFIEHMPPPGFVWTGKLRMEFSLDPTAAGFPQAVFMPRIELSCGGAIVSPSTRHLEVDADRRHAAISPDAETSRPIELQWDVGSPECGRLSFDAIVPFFIEGEAGGVAAIERVLRQAEDGPQ